MQYNIYCIHDLKSNYLNPTFDSNDATALRNFQHAVVSTNGIINSHPQDFRLFKIGTFNADTGLIEAYATPILIAEGSDMKNA